MWLDSPTRAVVQGLQSSVPGDFTAHNYLEKWELTVYTYWYVGTIGKCLYCHGIRLPEEIINSEG